MGNYLNPPSTTGLSLYIVQTIWACQICQDTIVVMEFRTTNKDIEIDRKWLAWPHQAPRELSELVPDPIRSLYREGSESEAAGALRAAAAMYRATVEEVCGDKGAQGSNLQKKIEDLKNKGASEDVVSDLDEARLLGNWSLHQGVEFSADEVADVAELIKDAVFEIYVQPAQREAMRQARRQRRSQA